MPSTDGHRPTATSKEFFHVAFRLVIAFRVPGERTGLVPAPLEAAEPKVNDRAEFFSKSAVEQATRKMQEIHRRFKVEVVIETFPSIPDNMKAQYKPDGEEDVLSPLGRDSRSRRRRERHLRADLQESGAPANRTRSNRSARRHSLIDERDALVTNAAETSWVKSSTMRPLWKWSTPSSRHWKPISASVPAGPLRPCKDSQRGSGSCAAAIVGLLGWICLAVVVLLAFWLVMAVFRAFRGGGSYGGMPGGGPAACLVAATARGYWPGYGGGGGFFSSLLGGMFGAAAGNWMYDSFFRGGSHGSSWGDTLRRRAASVRRTRMPCRPISPAPAFLAETPTTGAAAISAATIPRVAATSAAVATSAAETSAAETSAAAAISAAGDSSW